LIDAVSGMDAVIGSSVSSCEALRCAETDVVDKGNVMDDGRIRTTQSTIGHIADILISGGRICCYLETLNGPVIASSANSGSSADIATRVCSADRAIANGRSGAKQHRKINAASPVDPASCRRTTGNSAEGLKPAVV
jgi:hypothetical protein